VESSMDKINKIQKYIESEIDFLCQCLDEVAQDENDTEYDFHDINIVVEKLIEVKEHIEWIVGGK
jgi:hypothetical protein